MQIDLSENSYWMQTETYKERRMTQQELLDKMVEANTIIRLLQCYDIVLVRGNENDNYRLTIEPKDKDVIRQIIMGEEDE